MEEHTYIKMLKSGNRKLVKENEQLRVNTFVNGLLAALAGAFFMAALTLVGVHFFGG